MTYQEAYSYIIISLCTSLNLNPLWVMLHFNDINAWKWL